MNRLLFLFLDGVGLGEADRDSNPFKAGDTPVLRRLLGDDLTRDLEERDAEVLVRHLDTTLEHPGLPQSATGQGSLLTGSNCATLMGRHYGPWPGPTLRRFLERGTLFSEVTEAGSRAKLANAYPPGYFQAIESRRARTNVPVHAALAAGLELADLSAYGRGEALAADLTGEYFVSQDAGLPLYRPEEAGARLAGIAAEHHFTFFDFWLSDRIGHRGSFEEAVALVESLDNFVGGLVDGLGDVTLVVTSDHGNLENKRTRGHTRANVPLLVTGPGAGHFSACSSLLDVAPAVRRTLGLPLTGAEESEED